MDSCVLLHWALKRNNYAAVRAITFHYGQPHSDAERYAAACIAEDAEVPLHTVHLTHAFPRAGILAAVNDEDGAEGRNAAFVPNRNLTLLSIAFGYAMAWFPEGTIEILIGSCAEDGPGFPDCRPSAIQPFGDVLSSANQRNVIVRAPFGYEPKAGILRLAAELGCLDEALASWSCYRGAKVPCGACHACVVRQKAIDDYNAALEAQAARAASKTRLPVITGGDPAREAKLK